MKKIGEAVTEEALDTAEKVIKLGPSLTKWIESWKYGGFLKIFLLWIIVILFGVTFLMMFYCYSSIKNGITLDKASLVQQEKSIRKAIEDDRSKTSKFDSDVYNLSNKVEADVNQTLVSLRNNLDADRVSIIIFHDTEKMSSNLHFRFFSECYECVNYDRHVPEIADQFQKIKSSLFPIFSYLSENKSISGKLDKFKNIDPRYYHRLEEQDFGWVKMIYLRNRSGQEVGILTVTWLARNLNYKPTNEKIDSLTTEVSARLEALFDLSNPAYMLNN